ncbi:uncharacterized protein LOC127123768 [Lathyrus oleraceus]|uniref:uncharacterized protein LOC127123768 n=1 Tax=Pisum sativum TaxID=3888 RepID=UPI0021CE1C21|nr:uncharacterized protein LOC127123768 [Pisum sativum]
MAIDTPTNGSVTILLVCMNYSLTIYGKDFGVDLICLPLSQLNVILGINWLEFNHVHINCFEKIMLILEPGDSTYSIFIASNQVEMCLKWDDQMLMMFDSLRVESETVSVELHVVREFPDVFLEDIIDLLPEREVELAIDLVPDTRPLSIGPYRMCTSELSELKKPLEDLLKKKFLRPSVSLWGALVLLVEKKDGSMRLCVDYR